MRKALYGVVLTTPFFSLLLVLMGYPLVYNFYLSFHRWNVISFSPEIEYVGLGNYLYILPDIVFITSLKNTLIFTFLSVALEFLLGLVVAVLLSKIERGRKILTTIFMAPLMIASVVGAVMWRFLYEPFFGLFNSITRQTLGITVNWLSDSNIALYSVTIADVWKMWPFFAIIFLAGILSIPSERLESIRVDGASGWQEFRLVIFPHLLPLIFLAVVIRTIDAFTKVFDVVYMLTGGGPGFATQMVPLLLFQKALRSFRWGEAATLAVIALLISSIFYVVYNYTVKRR
ncbi:MAG: sugar ABC transporter permease [Candidatus Bathyarchaeia archaeon]